MAQLVCCLHNLAKQILISFTIIYREIKTNYHNFDLGKRNFAENPKLSYILKLEIAGMDYWYWYCDKKCHKIWILLMHDSHVDDCVYWCTNIHEPNCLTERGAPTHKKEICELKSLDISISTRGRVASSLCNPRCNQMQAHGF